jgi:hypothetical protein
MIIFIKFYIELGLFDQNGQQIKSSKSKFYVKSEKRISKPDNTISVNGLSVGSYGPCINAGVPAGDDKYIIYLGGIDPLENVSVLDIFSNEIEYTHIDALRNHGYTIVVVDWKNSMKSIEKNAEHVIELIENLKCAGDDPMNQFVVMGSSMGGIIGKYALGWMEKNFNQLNCKKQSMHNTRLYVSIDAPHQGAIIPLSFQHLIDEGAVSNLFNYGHIADFIAAKLFLNAKATKQLLAYHSSTSSNGVYKEHKNRKDFVSDLNNLLTNEKLGYCKEVAITSGDLFGNGQVSSNGTPVSDLSNFLSFEKIRHMNILGTNREMTRKNVELNANGNGTIYRDI